MGSGHAHSHGHSGQRGENRKRLAIVLAFSATYMVAEVVGGLVTGSLALLADAGHMLSDVAALGLALFAIWIAERPAKGRRTYGFYRTEILAALANGAALVAISVYIFVEAFQRFGDPPAIQGGLMMAIATGGLVLNAGSLWVLNAGKGESLNLKGAWLHVLSDLLGSVGAVTAGALIWAFGWAIADPIASVLIGLLVLYSSWALLKETVAVLMEEAPGHIDVDEVREAVLEIPEVLAMHDLHIWTITSGMVSLSAHVEVTAPHPEGAVLKEIRMLLHEEFGIDHLTIQMEPEEFEEREIRV